MTKQCKHCHKVKSLTDFYYSEKSRTGTINVCKECKNKQPDKIYHLAYEMAFYNYDKLLALYFK